MPNTSESLPEILARVAKAKTKEQRLEILRGAKYQQALQTILQGAFHPDIEWALPEGNPPYRKDAGEYGVSPSVLEKEVRKLVYFTPRLGRLIQNPGRREQVFIQMLESVHPSEAELLIQMKDKKIMCRGLTYKLVYEAFPNLLPEPVKKSSAKVAKEEKESNVSDE